MPASNVILKQITIKDTDGWTALSSSSGDLFDGVFECVDAAFSIRFKEGTSITLTSGGQYPMLNVDLSEIEVSTASSSDVNFLVVGTNPDR